MNPVSILTLLLLTAEPSAPTAGPLAEAGWEKAAHVDAVTVYSRERPGSNVREMKAEGMIDASPEAVWRAIRDYAHYDKTMPYTQDSKVLSSEGGGKVIHFYAVVNAPIVSRRDYVIRLVDESTWKDGKGFFKVVWTPSDKGPPPRDGLVRIAVNDGYWLLEPRAEGKKTFGTYYVYTDPGGSLPKFIVNKANGTAVPSVFKAIRKASGAPGA